ncbi:MAG: HNH endonuclease [Candidatus Sumerlaeota bacterium]|nr:HNH endonuclease [Candidatus Sumerlaeota bacterium]
MTYTHTTAHPLLSRRVLVLNRNWIAVHLCTVRRALGLLCENLAEVVTEDYETHDFESWLEVSQYAQTNIIHTPTRRVAIPEVIKLLRYKGFPPRVVKFSRRNIYLRDRMQCQYCGTYPVIEELTIDHVIPRSQGGKTMWTNVVLACSSCNTRKGSRSPRESGMALLTEPIEPHWLMCAGGKLPSTDEQAPLWQKFIDTAYWNVALRE